MSDKVENTPAESLPEKPKDLVDQALQELNDKTLTHGEIQHKLGSLKTEMQNGQQKPLDAVRTQALKDAVRKEVAEGYEDDELSDEEKNAFLDDLDQRVATLSQAAEDQGSQEPPPAEPSLFSKEGMKKAFDGSMKNLGETLTALAAVLDQLREQIAVSIGGSLDMMKSFIGEDKVNMLKGFIGEDRIQLSKALGAAKIALPMAAFLHARKSIEAVRGETAASVRGWTAERMSFVLVQKLTLAGVTGKEVEGDLEQKITDAVKILRDEVLATPLNGSAVNFAEAPQVATPRLTNAIMEGRQIDILSDGSVTVAGQKWKMKKSGKEIAINRADPATGGTLILEVQEGALRQTIVLTEDMPDMMNNLASATNTQVQAKGKDQAVLIEFVRNPS